MSWLFKIEGKKVFPNAETLLTPPFKNIWERDESEDKWMAMKEFTYIEFMTSQLKSNPYKGYSKEVRDAKLREDVIIDPTWQPDFLVTEGMKKIDNFQTEGSESYTMLVDALHTKNRLQEFLTTCDLTKTTDKGAMVIKPKDITSALLDLDKVVTTMNTLKKKVEEDLFEVTKTRANKEISPFANPNSIDN